MKRFGEQTKIGTGHASAFFRQGLRELRAAFYPESNVAQQSEYGLYGTRTPGEIAESRRAELEASAEPQSTLGERLQSARRDGQEVPRDARDLERE
jgi:hypothetical protein